MDVPPDEAEDDKTEHALYECALTELLAEGVATDVRPLLQKFQKAPAASNIAERNTAWRRRSRRPRTTSADGASGRTAFS